MVRGPQYLTDRVKVESQPSLLHLVCCDVTSDDDPYEHVGAMPGGLVERATAARGEDQPFLVIINFLVPGGINLVLCMFLILMLCSKHVILSRLSTA